MKEAARKTVEVINKVITDADVQPGYPDANGNTGTTWCNRAANRIAGALGFDMGPFLDARGINWTTANMMYRFADANAREITGAEAQRRTNGGELVLAACYNEKGPGHVAIVCPDDGEYDEGRGPLVGEAGAKCRIVHSKLAFEKWGYTARFFIIPRKEA